MEYINEIKLQGTIGHIYMHPIGTSKMARFSLCVVTTYSTTATTVPIVETTWFNCSAFEGEHIANLETLKTGDTVYLEGRVKTQMQDYSFYVIWEVICHTLKKVKI